MYPIIYAKDVILRRRNGRTLFVPLAVFLYYIRKSTLGKYVMINDDLSSESSTSMMHRTDSLWIHVSEESRMECPSGLLLLFDNPPPNIITIISIKLKQEYKSRNHALALKQNFWSDALSVRFLLSNFIPQKRKYILENIEKVLS